MKQILSLLLLSFSFLTITAQTQEPATIDSLKDVLSTVQGDERIILLEKLGNAMLNVNPYESVNYAEEGLKLTAEKHDSVKAGFIYTLSIAYGRVGNVTKQLELGKEAVGIYEKIHDEKRQTKAMSAVAMAYYNLGNYESSLRVQLAVLRIRERLKDNKGLAGTYNNLGIVYQRLNQTDEAIKSYEQALKYIENEKLEYLKGPVLNNLGSLYTHRGKYDEAMKALDNAFSLHRKNADNEGLLNTYINYGVLYTSLNNTDKAMQNYQAAYKISMETNDMHGLAITSLNLGVINNQLKKYQIAEDYVYNSLKISKENGFRDIEMDDYQNLASVYQNMGDYKQAYEYHVKYSKLKDSLFTQQASENMSKMRAAYEADKKEQDNILLNQQLEFKQLQLDRRQTTIYFAVILLLAFIVLTVSLYKLYLQKKKALSKELEMNRLISRFVSTVSHEFRTPLTGISSSVQLLRDFGNELDKKDQEKLFTKLNNSISELKSMLDDVTILDKGQSNRLTIRNDNFIFEEFCDETVRDILLSVDADHNIPVSYEGTVGGITTDRELLRHILSNIISNAIKYTDKGGEVRIISGIEETNLKIQVIDEGRGIPAEDLPYVFNDFYRGSNTGNIPGTGLGMSIVKTTLQALNGSIDLKSEPGKGTTVSVTIPGVVSTEGVDSNILMKASS